MAKLGFIMTGPQGGQIVELDEKELKKAIDDGWALDFEEANMGGKPDPFAGWNTEPHEKAEAYLTSKGLYENREMRSGQPAKSTTGDREDEVEQEGRNRDIAKDQAKTGQKSSKSTAKK